MAIVCIRYAMMASSRSVLQTTRQEQGPTCTQLRCEVRGSELTRVAVCFFGMIRNIHNTIDGIRTNLLEPIRRQPDTAVDVFVHTLLVERLSSSNEYHKYASENRVKVQATDFLELGPCRFAAEDQDLVDKRSLGRLRENGRTVDDTILVKARWVANARKLGKRDEVAKKLGVAHVGVKHYTDDMILNVRHAHLPPTYCLLLPREPHSLRQHSIYHLSHSPHHRCAFALVDQVFRAYWSLTSVAGLVRSHERLAGFKYTHIICARPDVAFLSPLRWRKRARDVIVVPNFAHNGGINDRFAYGERNSMMLFMDRFELLHGRWDKWMNTTEGFVCELLRQLGSLTKQLRRHRPVNHSLKIGVTPLCIVRTRATGMHVEELLNSTKSRLGLPTGCRGLALDVAPDDEEWPCAACIQLGHRGLLVARTWQRCLLRVSEPEPPNTSELLKLSGSVAQWTKLRASKQCSECSVGK